MKKRFLAAMAVLFLLSFQYGYATTQTLIINPQFQFWTSSGPLAGGAVWTYANGTTTPRATYTDYSGTTQNTNPVVLNSNGAASIWGNGSYTFVIYDAAGSLVNTINNVTNQYASGATSTITGGAAGEIPWQSATGTTVFTLAGTSGQILLSGGTGSPTWASQSAITAGNVITNANLTGPITSVGNATAIAAQTGTGSTLVTQNSPTLVTPNLGTPSVLVGTNISGTAAGLSIGGSAGNVTTNANLTGPITSVGNATAIAAQTGTGSTLVTQNSPTLVTPNLGTPSVLVGTNISGTAAGLSIGGSAATLATPRLINGVSFNGSADILPLALPVSTGSANTQAITSGFSALANGQQYAMKAGYSNSGSATLNPNSIGATTIKSTISGTTLVGGEIVAGTVYYLVCDGIYMWLTNPSAGGTATNATNATNAANIATAATTDNAAYYILGADSVGAPGNQPAQYASGVSFNPSTSTITATTFVGALTGNSTTTTTAATTNAISATGLAQVNAWTGSQSSTPYALSWTTNATSPNLALGNNFSVTLENTQSDTLSNPTNIVVGTSGQIIITQNGTGASTIAYGSYWIQATSGTATSVSTTLGAVNVLTYFVASSTKIFYVLNTGGVN